MGKVKRLHVDLSVVFRLFPPKEGGIGSNGKGKRRYGEFG